MRADVSPASFYAELAPGESVSVTKEVLLPADTPKLDLLLLVDLSGSYSNDLSNIKGHAPKLFDDIRAEIPDSTFGLATFVDFPFSPWGSASTGDYAYQLEQDLTTDRTSWLTAVNGMTTRYGGDLPESQFEGLYQAVTGSGREMPITDDDDYFDLGEIEPGLNATFRPDATKIIAMTTDASFHEGGDAGPFPYPGATKAETIAALQAAGIKVIAIKAPGSGTEMDDVAAATGGAVVYTGSTSAEIAQAILDGIDSIVFTVTANPDASCAPLEFAYTPDKYEDVPGGTPEDEPLLFDETITVPSDISAADLDADGKIICTVDFKADDTVIGTQTVEVYVPLNNPPVAQCQDLNLFADATCSANGDVDDGSYDPDGDPLAYEYSVAGPYEVGTHEVVLTVTDTSGESDSCTGFVTVVDATPPTVVLGPAIEVWPPNHKYVDLELADCVASVTDSCAGEIDIAAVGAISSIYSDEPENATGGGDGNTVDDIVIDGAALFSVRAERAGGGNGRVYGVTFEVADGAGNVAEATCYVSVPHANDGTPAVDDGPGAGYLVQ